MEYLNIDWNFVKSKVRGIDPNVFGLLNSCRVFEVNNHTIVLKYASEVLAGQMAKTKNKDALIETLRIVTGKLFEIETEVIINKNAQELDNLPYLYIAPTEEQQLNDQQVGEAVRLISEYAGIGIMTRTDGNWGVYVHNSSEGKEFINRTLYQCLKEALRYCIETKTVQFDYHEYLKSEQWKERSKEAKERAGWRCQLCNKSNDETQLHAHHRTYERIGNELPEDITVLCADCHAKFHDKE